MKIVETMAAQGDVLFRRISALPAGARDVTPKEGPVIVAHSETGHHHIAVGENVHRFETDNPLVCCLQASGDVIRIDHLRSFDTHAPFALGGGAGAVWEVIRQREHTPEGWRRVED